MPYILGDCVLDPNRRELHRAGAPVKLQRKVYQVLAYLIAHRNRLVTREELLEHIWPGVYVEDYAVARSITAARRAVGDSRQAQRVIQTVHGQGYRFIATVTEEHPTLPATDATWAPLAPPWRDSSPKRSGSRLSRRCQWPGCPDRWRSIALSRRRRHGRLGGGA